MICKAYYLFFFIFCLNFIIMRVETCYYSLGETMHGWTLQFIPSRLATHCNEGMQGPLLITMDVLQVNVSSLRDNREEYVVYERERKKIPICQTITYNNLDVMRSNILTYLQKNLLIK